MRPDRAAEFTAAIGNHQNKNKQATFKAYQGTQRQLHRTTADITNAGPQQLGLLTGLFFVAAVSRPAQRFHAPAAHVTVQHPSQEIAAPIPASAIAGTLARAIPLDPTALARSVRSIAASEAARPQQLAAAMPPPSNSTPPAPSATMMAASPADDDCADDVMILREKNHQLTRLLQDHDYLPRHEKNLPVARLLNAAIRFLQEVPQAASILAAKLQAACGHYGATPDEAMSLPAQQLHVRHWLVLNIYGENLDAFIERYLLDNDGSSHFNNSDLIELLVDRIHHPNILLGEKRDWLLQHVVFAEVPGLHYLLQNDQQTRYFYSMSLHDFEWGQTHAGLRFLQSTGVAIESVPIHTASALGKLLLTQLMEGNAPLEWWQLFRLPASMRCALGNRQQLRELSADAAREIRIRALIDYGPAYRRFLAMHDPVAKFKTAMRRYKSRTHLAKDIINQHCRGLQVSTYLRNPAIPCIRQRRQRLDLPDRFNSVIPPDQITRLPDINQEYQAQIDDIANTFANLDKALLISAWSQLADDDINYMAAAEITRVQAMFSASDELNHTPVSGANQAAREGLQVSLEQACEFFSARKTSQTERIYALQKNTQGYLLKRVDRYAANYYDFLSADQRPVGNASYKLIVRHVGTPLKQSRQLVKELFNNIAEKHRSDFAGQLYEYGYDKTPVEITEEFLLSMIPFYTCVTSIHDRAVKTALLACAADTLALVPLFGNICHLSSQLATLLGRGAMMAAHGAATEMALQHSLQSILRQGVADFTRYGLLPASTALKRQALEELAHLTLQAFDPGFALLGSISSNTIRQTVRLLDAVTERFDGLQNLLPRLQTLLHRLPQKMATTSYLSAHLSGRKQTVPVIRLGGDQYQNKNIYVRVHVENGEPFGPKYVLSKSNTLEALPSEVARRLHNVLQRNPDKALAEAASTAQFSGRRYSTVELARVLAANPAIGIAFPDNPHWKNLPGQAAMSIQADPYVKKHFHTSPRFIETADGTYYDYDIDLNAFIRSMSDQQSVYVVDSNSDNIAAIDRATRQNEMATISLDQRTAVIRALGVDLDIAETLNRELPRLEKRIPIPKTIHFIWVGNKCIDDLTLSMLKLNRETSNNAGYKVHFYLSKESKQPNYMVVQDALCGSSACLTTTLSPNRVDILEETALYKKFKESENFAQYNDAIRGNGGIATNFASASDILRLFVVKENGGLYMDIDDRLLQDFGTTELTAQVDGFVLGGLMNAEHAGMYRKFGTSFFGAHAGNTVIDKILKEMHQRYQLPEYRDFYKKRRPPMDDKSGQRDYASRLFQLTGPNVFNSILHRENADIRDFIELAKLNQYSYRAYASDIFQQLQKKIPSADDICPLARLHDVGGMHSWELYR